MSGSRREGWPAAALRLFAHSRATVPVLLLIAAVVRIRWAVLVNHLKPYATEMHGVAVTLARTGTIAGTYKPDGIPTTHVGPIAPVPGAVVYRLLGVDSPASELVLTCVATATVCAILFLLDRVFGELGEHPLGRRLAMAAAAIFPVDLATEARDFRIREGAYATCILLLVLHVLLRMERRRAFGWMRIAALALGCAFLFLLSPAAALLAYAACGVFTLRNVAWPRWPAVAGIAAGLVVLVSLPWALRNHAERGEWVWSRGNAGLELAVGTHAGAVDPADPSQAFVARLDEIHPYKSDAAYRAMMTGGGEVAYAQRLGRETWAWAAAHPGDSLRIWTRHVREFYFPPHWLWSAYGSPKRGDTVREYWTYAVTGIALLGLVAALRAGRTKFWYPAAMIAVAVVPYVVAQPRTRYRYTITTLLLFLAMTAVVRLVRRWLGPEPDQLPAKGNDLAM